jgi:hypothetical protein
VIFVQLIGKNGVLAASQEGQPAGGLYPTHSWERGEVIRDVMTLFLPPDTPDGLYRLEAGMYDQSGAPLTVLRLTRRSLDHVDLGTVEVRGRPRSQVVPSLRNPVNARLGTLARLVGYDMSVGGVPVAGPEEAIARPGDRIDLKLVWQAMEPTRTSYIVFVHLLGPDGKVASQDDAVPGRGALPTSSWVRNEVLVDSYALPVPSTAMAGQYLIEVGMYDGVSGKRLQLWDANGSAIGDSLILTKVRVERAP